MNKMNKQSFKESLARCQHLLKEKRLSEATVEELEAIGAKLRKDTNAAVAAANLVSLNTDVVDMDQIDLPKVLNTSESDTNPESGAFTEAYVKAHTQPKVQVLKEARTYDDIVADYKRQGGTDDFEAFQNWIATQPDYEKGAKILKRHFIKMFQYAAAGEPVAVKNTEPPSKELTDLIDLIDANDNFVETAVDTVTTKYEMIELKLRRVIRGKSVKRYYMLAGDAGIGKTFIVNSLLEEAGKLESTPVVTGSIGRNPTTVAEFLWNYRDQDLVIMDDCDTFLRKDANPDVINMLKGAMEPGTNFHVHITSSIAARLNNVLKAKKKENYDPEELNKLYESEDDELIDDDDIEDEGSIEPEAAVDDSMLEINDTVPTDWTFNARLVIISNLHENQINDALWSRCDHFDLHLTQEEYLVRLGMIINKMDIGQKDGIYEEADVQAAKDLLMSLLGPLIEAGMKGVNLFGKTIQLKEHLEFRLVKDVIDMWLSMIERYVETHPGATKEDAKKACLKKWVRVVIIPRISA